MSTELCAREAHLVSGPAGLWLPLLLFANADLLPQYLSCVGRDPRSDRTRMQILVQSKRCNLEYFQILVFGISRGSCNRSKEGSSNACISFGICLYFLTVNFCLSLFAAAKRSADVDRPSSCLTEQTTLDFFETHHHPRAPPCVCKCTAQMCTAQNAMYRAMFVENISTCCTEGGTRPIVGSALPQHANVCAPRVRHVKYVDSYVHVCRGVLDSV